MNNLSLFGLNYSQISAVAVPAIIKKGGVDYKSVSQKVYSEMSAQNQITIKSTSCYKNIKKYNNMMNEPAKAWDDYLPIFNIKVTVDSSLDNGEYACLKTDVYKHAKGDVNAIKRLRAMALKSINLLRLYKIWFTAKFLYLYNSDNPHNRIIDDFELPQDLEEKDKEFINAIGEYCWPMSHIELYPEAECPNLEKYNIGNSESEWEEFNMINDTLIEQLEESFRGLFKVPKEDLPKPSIPMNEKDLENGVKISSKHISFSDLKYESPIIPITDEDFYSPVIFLKGENFRAPETKTKLKPSVAVDIDFPAKKENKDKEKEMIIRDEDVPENFTKEEFRNIVSVFEKHYKNKLGYTIRKDQNNIPFIDVKKDDGTVVSNIIDLGRFAGGKRVSIIGTAVDSISGVLYPQFIDVDKHPDIAYKILVDDKYHLTEKERVQVIEGYFNPNIYMRYDFSNTEFISDIKDKNDFDHFGYNITAVYKMVEAMGVVDARLRIIHFNDINNFTVVSDEKCSSAYINYGIPQNRKGYKFIRIEVRDGKIINNSTRNVPQQQQLFNGIHANAPMVDNQPQAQPASPFINMNNQPQAQPSPFINTNGQPQSATPLMNGQVQSMLNSKFMQSLMNEQQNNTASFGNFMNMPSGPAQGGVSSEFMRVERPQEQKTDATARKVNIPDNLKYEDIIKILSNPLTSDEYREGICAKYPELAIKFQVEVAAKK